MVSAGHIQSQSLKCVMWCQGSVETKYFSVEMTGNTICRRCLVVYLHYSKCLEQCSSTLKVTVVIWSPVVTSGKGKSENKTELKVNKTLRHLSPLNI